MVKVNKYREDVCRTASLPLPWDRLAGKTILISGASGLIGTFLIDVLMCGQTGVRIVALGRNEEDAKKRFADYWNLPTFTFIRQDVNDTLALPEGLSVDYILHGASNTHPMAYASDPVGTMTTNLFGTKHLLDAAVQNHCARVIFLSSVEVYGENRGDVECFDETYCGYLDCNTLRAGYPDRISCTQSITVKISAICLIKTFYVSPVLPVHFHTGEKNRPRHSRILRCRIQRGRLASPEQICRHGSHRI